MGGGGGRGERGCRIQQRSSSPPNSYLRSSCSPNSGPCCRRSSPCHNCRRPLVPGVTQLQPQMTKAVSHSQHPLLQPLQPLLTAGLRQGGGNLDVGPSLQ